MTGTVIKLLITYQGHITYLSISSLLHLPSLFSIFFFVFVFFPMRKRDEERSKGEGGSNVKHLIVRRGSHHLT